MLKHLSKLYNKHLFFLILLCIKIQLLEADSPNLDHSSVFINSSYQVTDTVVNLLGKTGIYIKNDPTVQPSEKEQPLLILSSRDLKEVMEAVQGKISAHVSWKRAENTERWEINNPSLPEDKLPAKDIIDSILEDLNQGEEIHPQQSSYKGVLLLGSSLKDFFNRVAYLVSLKGIDLSTPLILLTGDRTLSVEQGETYETWKELTKEKGTISLEEKDFPKEEKEMMELVMKHFGLKYKLYCASKHPGTIRATTADTMKEYLSSQPVQGTYLAISSQPFVKYQSLVIERNLLQFLGKNAEKYTIEVIGHSVSPQQYPQLSSYKKALILLDNMARIFYELQKIRELKNQ